MVAVFKNIKFREMASDQSKVYLLKQRFHQLKLPVLILVCAFNAKLFEHNSNRTIWNSDINYALHREKKKENNR